MFRAKSTLLLAVLLAACGGDRVTVQVVIPDERGVSTPVSGLRLTFLPYDRDSLTAALEAQADQPRPDTSPLDSLFQEFREPFGSYLRIAADYERLGRSRDSLLASDPAGRLAGVEDSLGTLRPVLEAARTRVEAARRRLGAGDSLRAALSAWQDYAYRDYDSLTRVLVRQSRLEATIDSTRTDGWVTVELRPGRWWLTARAINVGDPNAQWYWNVPVVGDTIILSPANGRSRMRLP